MTIKEIIQLIRDEGSTLAKPVEVAGMSPMTFACTLSNQPALKSELSMLSFDYPNDLQSFWKEAATAQLFVDQNYGQWGLEILSPMKSMEATACFCEERQSDSRLGDLVIGKFLGDSDLLIVRCDTTSSDLGTLVVALPLDPRIEWDIASESFTGFLEKYVKSGGEKFWSA